MPWRLQPCGHPQSQGSTAHPCMDTAGSALAQVMVGQPLAGPHTSTLCMPYDEGLEGLLPRQHSTGQLSHFLAFLLGRQSHRLCSPPPCAQPCLLPFSWQYSQAAFLPGPSGKGSMALPMPLPHQLPGMVLLGDSINYSMLSLRNHCPGPCCGHTAGSALPEPLPTGPAPLLRAALTPPSPPPVTFNCWDHPGRLQQG